MTEPYLDGLVPAGLLDLVIHHRLVLRDPLVASPGVDGFLWTKTQGEEGKKVNMEDFDGKSSEGVRGRQRPSYLLQVPILVMHRHGDLDVLGGFLLALVKLPLDQGDVDVIPNVTCNSRCSTSWFLIPSWTGEHLTPLATTLSSFSS